ncbi:MAG: IS630 family transposase [Actinobacteria bacterium]|nr:IS630 family transposase [Actinomycetota bacterium]
MRKTKYTVRLTEAERARLRTLIGQGTAPTRTLTHARILLKANQGEGGPAWTDAAIAGALEVHPATVGRVRRTYVEIGVDAALTRKAPDRVYQRRLDGEQEARLVAVACSAPPEGRTRWTLRLLADEVVRLEVVDTVSYETVRRTLQPHKLKPWLREQWCLPPETDAAFVWQMEDVLDVYTRPHDPARPVVCLDETSRQLLAETREPLPVVPGQPARHDPEYARAGVVNLFLVCEPARGWRQVRVRAQRTRIDWAHWVKELVDVHSPAAETIVLVMDQLNTHSPASLYEAFAPAEAKRLAAKLEIHHTPKHGSWLNMAEIELSVLQRQCLNRRLGDRATVEREVAAWVGARNHATTTIAWRFTTADARIKLTRLYPAVHA